MGQGLVGFGWGGLVLNRRGSLKPKNPGRLDPNFNLDLFGQSDRDGALPSNRRPELGLTLRTNPSAEILDGDIEQRADVHSLNIYPKQGISTPDIQILPQPGVSHTREMSWSLQNFENAVNGWLAQDPHRTKKELAVSIGCTYQHLLNVLGGQKSLKKYAPKAAEILGWPNVDFSDPPSHEIDAEALTQIYLAITKYAASQRRRISDEEKIRLTIKVYELAFGLHSFNKPTTEKIHELTRLALSS